MSSKFYNNMTYKDYVIHLNEEYSSDTDNEDIFFDVNIYDSILIGNKNNSNNNDSTYNKFNVKNIIKLKKLKNKFLYIFCCIS